MQAFHAEHPAVTAEMLGHGRAPEGRFSYCVDLSPEALAPARQRPTLGGDD